MTKPGTSPSKQAPKQDAYSVSEHVRLEVEILESEAAQAASPPQPEAQAPSRGRQAKRLGSLLLLAVLLEVLVGLLLWPSVAGAQVLPQTGVSEEHRARLEALLRAVQNDEANLKTVDIQVSPPQAASKSASTTAVVDTDVYESDGSCADGDCSLPDALVVVAASGGGTVTFDAGLDGATITFDPVLGPISLTGPPTAQITVDASALPNGITFSGGDAMRLFIINDLAATFFNITFTEGVDSTAGGGALRNNRGTLTLQDCAVTNSQAESGGGISNVEGTLRLIDSEVSGNTATGFLGGDGTEVGGFGGGIISLDFPDPPSPPSGPVELVRSTISNNVAKAFGSTGGFGGGIALLPLQGGVLNTITDSFIMNNRAERGSSGFDLQSRGGGIYLTGPSDSFLSIFNTTISENSAQRGSGIHVQGNLQLEQSIIKDNGIVDIAIAGGGLHTEDNGTTTISDTDIVNNLALRGGGMFLFAERPGPSSGGVRNADITRSTISNNEATCDLLCFEEVFGGGIVNSGGTLTITASTLDGNRTARLGDDGKGGGIYNAESSTTTLTNTTLRLNRAEPGTIPLVSHGGAIYSEEASTLTLTNSTLKDNIAAFGQGLSFAGSTLHLRSSSMSSRFLGSACELVGGAGITTNEYMLIEDGTCNEVDGGTPIGFLTGDPMLDDLADNGGPTQTHLPLLGSPLLDAGSCNGLTEDQRGQPRPTDFSAFPNAADGCDIGAVEATEDEVPPSASLNDIVVGEADGTATFTVTLSHPGSLPVTLDYATTSITATGGDDYSATFDQLTIPAGETSGTIDIPIFEDTVDEDDETFALTLLTADNATIDDGEGIATIEDNDTTDLALTKDDGDLAASPDGVIQYTLTVTNNGTHAAPGVMLTEIVPDHTTFYLADSDPDWSCSNGAPAGTECTLNIGTVSASASEDAVFAVRVVTPLPTAVTETSNTATVPVDGPNGPDATPADNTATDDTPLEATPDLALTKDDGGLAVMPGDVIIYTLTVTNNGDQDAIGVEITETVPENTTFDASGSTAGWSCTDGAPAGTICTVSTDDLAGGGDMASADFAVLVDKPLDAGIEQITNTASVADDGVSGDDPNPDDNTASDTTPVDAMAMLAATLSDALAADLDGDGDVGPGDTIEYTAEVTNTGDQDASDVVYTQTVDANTSLSCVTVDPGPGMLDACTDGAGGSFTVDLTTVAGEAVLFKRQATATITFEASVLTPLPAGVETVSTQGSVSFTGDAGTETLVTDDQETAAALDATVTAIDAVPNLVLAKDDSGVTVMPGQVITYTLSYTNGGNQGATGVTLTETVPAHTTFTGSGWTCIPDATAGSICTFTVAGEVAGGGTGQVDFEVTVIDPVPAGVEVIDNTASVEDDGSNGDDPNLADNTASDTTPVDAMAMLAATLDDALLVDTDGDDQTDPGETLEYTATVTNTGDQDAADVTYTQTVDSNTALDCASVTFTQGTLTDCTDGPGGSLTVSLTTVDGEPNVLFTRAAETTITFEATITTPFPAGVEAISTQGSVSFTGGATVTDDPETPTTLDQTVTTIDAIPDLVLDKDDGAITATPGEVIDYTLTVCNDGDQDASGVTLSEIIPDHTSFDASSSDPDWTCIATAPGSTCTLEIGALSGGGVSTSAVFAVVVDRPIAAGAESIENTASAQDDGAGGDDPTPDDNTDSETTPVSAMARISATLSDALLVDTDGDGQADPGERLRYTATVTNTGSQGAAEVVFTDTLDVNTLLVTGSVTTTQGTVTSGNSPGETIVAVDLTTVDGQARLLAAQAEARITFEAVISVPFPARAPQVQTQGSVGYLGERGPETIRTDDPATRARLDPTRTQIERTADLALSKTVDNTTPAYQSAVTFTLAVSNHGPVEPAGATVEDVLPPGLVYVNHTTTSGSYEPATGQWQTRGLSVGATAMLALTARVESLAPVTNTASIARASLSDPASSNDQASATITPVAADLAVEKRVIGFTSDRGGPGSEDDTVTGTFLISVVNHGPSVATGVFVVDPVPEGATLDAAMPTQGSYDLATETWTVGTLTVGASATLTVTLTASASNNLMNRAEVFADQADQDGRNNLAGASGSHDPTDLGGLTADLGLTKTVDNATPSVGDVIVYRLVVRNSGPSTTSGVAVRDSLPAGLAYVSARVESAAGRCATCGYSDSLGVWRVGHLPKDSSAVLLLTARVTGTGQITNTAEVIESHLPDLDSVLGNGAVGEDDADTAVIVVSTGKATSAVRASDEASSVQYELGGNYPNPFNPETVIPFEVPESAEVTVEVFNLVGQRVALLLDQPMAAGRYEVVWRAEGVPTGLYLVRLRAGSFVAVRRVTLVK